LFYIIAVRGEGENVEGHRDVVGRSSSVVSPALPIAASALFL
jgi:hypothetical protein